MKQELIVKMDIREVAEVHEYYCGLLSMYEQLCDGPRGAMAHTEYHAIRKSISALNQRYTELFRETYGREEVIG